ncbi:MAG: hypothetical protein ACLFWB_12540 [Armatimonadota bacterium]
MAKRQPSEFDKQQSNIPVAKRQPSEFDKQQSNIPVAKRQPNVLSGVDAEHQCTPAAVSNMRKREAKTPLTVSGVRVRMEVEVHQPCAIIQQANVANRHTIEERTKKPWA